MNQERVSSNGSSLFKRMVLWTLCFIGAAAAVRRIVALLIPATSPRVQQMVDLDAQFSRRMGLTLAHIVPALIFVVLLPAWFSARVRENGQAHRRLTWVLLVLGAVIGLTSLPLVTQPVGGTTEVAAILFFDGLFLFSLARAWLLFVRGDLALHREWMMRAVAVLLGIATTRPVMGVFFATSRLTHLEPHQFFGIAFWIGFSATYVAGEIYLQRNPVHSKALAQSRGYGGDMERRSVLFANLTVLSAAIVVSTGFGASLVETVIHMSRYFADPPASFATWYGDQTHSTSFWMPLQLGELILLIVALAANWRFSARKRFLAIGLTVYVAIAVWTGAYFAREVQWLLRVAHESVVPADFVSRAHRWYVLTWVRQVAAAVPFFAVMLALMTPVSASGVSEWRAEPAVG